MKNWTKRWRTMAAAASLSALATGCNGTTVPEPQAVVNRASLQAFQGDNACADLEQYIEDTAVLQMRTQLEAARDGVPSWGWWGGGLFRGGIDAATADSAAGAKSAPTNYTTTNNQVAGVDEADFVKNDGTRIFVLSGDKLNAVRSWPAETASLQGTLKIEGWPQEMFLDGQDRVVVFSSIYQWYPLSKTAGDSCASLDCGYWNSNTVKTTIVDVSDLTKLRVVREVYVPGYYSSARKIGSSVRMVLSDNFNFPDGFKWWPEYDQATFNDPARLRAAFNQIIADNEKLIRKQTLKEWVPASKIVENGQTTVVPHACTAFSKVNAPTRLGMVGVVTMNLAAATASLDRTTILAEPGQIYASQNNLYVATQHWWWWPAPGQKDTTYIHKFDISNPNAAIYVASGTVDGHIKDQFSMDEGASGHFRVVTNLATRVTDPSNPTNWWGTLKFSNRVSVLGENAGYLDVVGQTPDFAEGETIQASRIVGDRGFVVTFRQVDPLFTFDLSNPLNPRKVGEVSVPGFSTYMQPIDDTHLLTIGEFVPAPVNGQTDWSARTLQLAIFDVSNMAHPVQTFVQQVGTAYSWSEALYEHKAFNYFAAKKLLAIPFSDWSYGSDGNLWWDRFVSDLRVYGVDANNGFTVKGAVSLSDMYVSEHWGNWVYYWTPSVRRSVMADDFVYAISDAGLRVANLANLSAPLTTAHFQRYTPTP